LPETSISSYQVPRRVRSRRIGVDRRHRRQPLAVDRHREQPPAPQDHQMIAVHLDDAAFVDAGMLHVGDAVFGFRRGLRGGRRSRCLRGEGRLAFRTRGAAVALLLGPLLNNATISASLVNAASVFFGAMLANEAAGTRHNASASADTAFMG
jgi:hypothetical protein